MKVKKVLNYKIVCQVCKKPFKTSRPQYKYCAGCRKIAYRKLQTEGSRRFYAKNTGLFSKGKLKCKICGKWYIQLCSHVIQKHGMTSKEYKQMLGTYTSKGLIPKWYHDLKSEQVKPSSKLSALIHGYKTRFKPGDSRAGNYQRSEEHLKALSALGKRTGLLNIKKTRNHNKHNI
jgi:hypothetical protein